MRTVTSYNPLGTGKAATGLVSGGSKGLLVSDFRHIIVYIVADTTAAFTIKAKSTIADAKPDFTASQSRTNPWEYVQMKDLSDGSTVNGANGIAFVADGVRMLEINTNGISWLDFDVTAYTTGQCSIYYKGFSENN